VSINSQAKTDTERPAEQLSNWQPELLQGDATPAASPGDLDLHEVWYWLHARLRALGDLNHDTARLVALLHWNPSSLGRAMHAARLEIDRDEDGGTRQVHLEFLTAEYLAREALERQAIPAPELRSA
jgi:hypothetical protein